MDLMIWWFEDADAFISSAHLQITKSILPVLH